jgi:hypothetical protein
MRGHTLKDNIHIIHALVKIVGISRVSWHVIIIETSEAKWHAVDLQENYNRPFHLPDELLKHSTMSTCHGEHGFTHLEKQ